MSNTASSMTHFTIHHQPYEPHYVDSDSITSAAKYTKRPALFGSQLKSTVVLTTALRAILLNHTALIPLL